MRDFPKVLYSTSFILFVLLMTGSAALAGGRIAPARVSTKWVAKNLDAVKIIDLRYDEYARNHLPGAIKMQWGDEVASQSADHMLPPNLSETRRVLSKMGVEPKDHIVLYDESANVDRAIRIYWALKYWSYSRVSIMQGGLALWQAENRPLTYKNSVADNNSSNIIP